MLQHAGQVPDISVRLCPSSSPLHREAFLGDGGFDVFRVATSIFRLASI